MIKLATAVVLLAIAAGLTVAWEPGSDSSENRTATGDDDVSCDRVSKPGERPTDLVESLLPGETGCLRGGIHIAKEDVRVLAPDVTLTSYPGETASLVGRLWVTGSAGGATIENLILDGRNEGGLPSPTVNADDVVFRNTEVTNDHSGICFVLGDDEYGRASGTVIEDSEIHDCGRLPATNHDHGIYVAIADGTVIRDNLIYDNADRGIQLYPNADGTLVTGNVIDGNGQGVLFGGDADSVSEDNLVEHNIITNSTIRYNVESSWQGSTGSGNVVRGNCVYGGVRDDGDGGIEPAPDGFEAPDNVIEGPVYVDREAGDFRLDEASPCLDLDSDLGSG